MVWDIPIVYAIKHKSSEVRLSSQSGGAFTAVSNEILKMQGVIYGCVLTDDFTAAHIRATKYEDRDRMRGSKYIESNMCDVFTSVKTDLEDGRMVLFSGTSCQVAGLLSFLGEKPKNLLCVDILCHGVPSPKVWKSYIKWQEHRVKGVCVDVNFRNKKFGWSSHFETLTMADKTGNLKEVKSEVFKTIFGGDTILRPCCYQCPYKSSRHPGDITIADYWGIDKAAPGFKDDKGVSLVLINSESGLNAFNFMANDLEVKKCRLEDSIQPVMIKPFVRPKERNKFWEDFVSLNFDKIVKRYGCNKPSFYIKHFLQRLKRYILRKVGMYL